MMPISALLFAMICHQALNLVAHIAQLVCAVQICQFYTECKPCHLATNLFYQLSCRNCCSASCYQVVSNQDVFTFSYRGLLELHHSTAVFDIVSLFQSLAGQLASLAHHDHTIAKL